MFADLRNRTTHYHSIHVRRRTADSASKLKHKNVRTIKPFDVEYAVGFAPW